jgi:signal transduction histidine kinase
VGHVTVWTSLLPAALAVAAAASAVRGIHPVNVASTVAAAVVSAAVSGITAAGRVHGSAPPGWGAALLPLVIEWTALALLTVRFAHRGRPGTATLGAGTTGLALSLLVLRLTAAPTPLAAIAACGLWGLAAVAAIAVGLHLRAQDRRRARHVAEARREQRLRLARDLHDFVAHDVSEMVAGAQAGQVVATDPTNAAALFRRIEQAGQHALATLDRTVHMLDTPGAFDGPGPESLPELIDRFGAAGPARTVVDLDPALTGALPAEVSAVAYRVVAEALTNVRRHAPAATVVSVAVARAAVDLLSVTVTNDRSTAMEGPARGAPAGNGLAGLAAAVGALGGTVDARPHGGGWRLVARIPL